MSTSPTPHLEFEAHGAITLGTVVSADMLDAMNVTDFGNEVMAYVQDSSERHLLLNFKNVGYMSSAALTELLRINEVMRKQGGSVRLCGLTKDIRKVFEITNLEKLFVIHEGEDVNAALNRFERSLEISAKEDAWSSGDEKN